MSESIGYDPHEKSMENIDPDLQADIDEGEAVAVHEKGIVIEKAFDHEPTAEGRIYDFDGRELGFYHMSRGNSSIDMATSYNAYGPKEYKCEIFFEPITQDYTREDPNPPHPEDKAYSKYYTETKTHAKFQPIVFPLEATTLEEAMQEVMHKIPQHLVLKPVKANLEEEKVKEFLAKHSHLIEPQESESS